MPELLRQGGLAYFVVFSEGDPSYGRGNPVEDGTFESKPGRPVYHSTDGDLREHFRDFEILETGSIDDSEKHGEEGPHVHRLRFIVARKPMAWPHGFDGREVCRAPKGMGLSDQASGRSMIWNRNNFAVFGGRKDGETPWNTGMNATSGRA